jgi:hypothetical protein
MTPGASMMLPQKDRGPYDEPCDAKNEIAAGNGLILVLSYRSSYCSSAPSEQSSVEIIAAAASLSLEAKES